MKPVTHYFPSAEVYFLGSSWDYFHGVEVRDLVSVNASLNVSGTPGTFNITLNNQNDQYFVDDNLSDIVDINPDDAEIQAEGLIAWLRKEHMIEEVTVEGKIYSVITDSVTGERFYWKDGEGRAPHSNVTKRSGRAVELYTKYGGMLNRGKCILRSMDRIAIFFRRRYPKTEHEMIRVFTGIVSTVQDRDSGSSREIIITGEDVTKWFRLSRANVNPSLLTLADTEREPVAQAYYTNAITTGLQGWQIVEVLIAGGNLKDYGAADVPIRGVGQFQVNRDENPASRNLFTGKAKSEVSNLSALEMFQRSRLNIQIPSTDSSFIPYKKYFSLSGSGMKSEYRDRASILQEVAKDTNFWLYADGNGDINYHAPRFNLRHILAAPNPEVYILDQESILSWALTEDEKDLWSRIEVTGREDFQKDGNIDAILRWNWYENSLLIARYGLRVLLIDHPFVRTEEDAYYLAKTLMIRLNKERLQGQVTLLGRPELRAGYPTYLPHRNMIYNVMSVEHSYVQGDTFTTSAGLAYGRKPWDPLPEMLDYGTGTDSQVNYQSDLLSTHAARQDKDAASRKRERADSVRTNADIKWVVIHHSGDPADNARTLAQVHRTQMGWVNGLGYDVVILRDGILQIGNRWVNASTDSGIVDRATIGEFVKYTTHRWAGGCDVQEINIKGVHVCLVGDLNTEAPTAPQMTTLIELLRACVSVFSLHHPHAIKGHNDFEPKDCPGAMVSITDIRLRVSHPQELKLKRAPELLIHRQIGGVYSAP